VVKLEPLSRCDEATGARYSKEDAQIIPIWRRHLKPPTARAERIRPLHSYDPRESPFTDRERPRMKIKGLMF
jgi:hypothetical protein